MKRYTAILFVALLLSLAVTAYAGGAKYTWKIEAAGPSKSGCTIIVVDQLGTKSTIDGDASDLKGLLAYYGVAKPEELKGFRLKGNTLEYDLNAAAQWALHMSQEDEKVECLVKGLRTFKNFVLPKDMTFCSLGDFVRVNGTTYLNKRVFAKIDERLQVTSNYTCELIEAKAEDFSVLPKAMCYGTYAVKETVMTLESTAGLAQGSSSETTMTHRFTLSADCRNAVLWDADASNK